MCCSSTRGHVLKLDGDVPHLYLEILPALGSGSVVHVHDVPSMDRATAMVPAPPSGAGVSGNYRRRRRTRPSDQLTLAEAPSPDAGQQEAGNVTGAARQKPPFCNLRHRVCCRVDFRRVGGFRSRRLSQQRLRDLHRPPRRHQFELI